MEMQTFGKRPVPRGRVPRPEDRDVYWARGPELMRVGQNYELARGVADRFFLGPDMTNGRSISASSGYGTREDSSSSEDIALRTLPGPSHAGDMEGDYPFNSQDIQMERNGNYYSTVKPLITVVKPQAGSKVRARVSLPPSPTCEQDDNYNFSKTPEYGKLEVNLGDMLERLQSDLVGLRDSLRPDARDNEPLINTNVNTTRATKCRESNYEQLDSPWRKKRTRPDYAKPKWNVPFRQRFLEEFSGSGIHGLRTALRPEKSPCVRIIWVILFFCCLGALCIQLWDRVSLFTTNPTHVMVDKRYTDQLTFPAITICSLNMFRLTKIVDLDLYSVAHSLLHKDESNLTVKQLKGVRNLDGTYKDFIHHVGHQKEDLIESCSWYGKDCSATNFTEIITDYGLCFVFHPKFEDGVVRRAGQNAGLSLLLNVEHYEYLFGRKSSVGVRVSVHDSAVLPEVESKGVNVPVGSFTTLMIQKVTEHHRPSTLSDCVQSSVKSYNRSVCLVDYEEEMIMERCNCSTKSYDWNRGTMKVCNARDYFTCIVQVKGRLNENKRVSSCPSYCDFTEYDLTLSEAGLPVYAAEGRLQRLNKGGVLERNFQQARDIYHRSDKVLLDHDIHTLTKILEGFNQTKSSIYKMFAPLQQDTLTYENSFDELKEALKMLKSSSEIHYDAFRQSRHVDFFQETITKHIEDNMDDILQSESVIDDIRNYMFRDANGTLGKISRKLERLGARQAISHKYSGFFVEITNGIERFRDDLVDGYGQNYREFKDSKQFYSQKVNISLNLTRTIRDSLLENYNVISNITDQFRPSQIPLDKQRFSEDLVKNLTKFFKAIRFLKENPLPQLFSELKALEDSYIPHRQKILELSDTLNEMDPYIRKIDTELDGFFQKVESTLTNLQSGILSLSKNLADLANKYKENRFQKTELSEKINDDRLKAKISSAESYLLELRTIVSSLLETGRKIFDFLQPIGHRLKDFDVLLKKDQNKLMSSLRFESLEKTVNELSQRVEEQLSTLNDLQTELDDYHRGSRLNGKFYLNNFLQLEVYFPELAETVITHEETYGLIALACDIGSSLALYLGISLLTVFGLLDLVVRTLMGSGGSTPR